MKQKISAISASVIVHILCVLTIVFFLSKTPENPPVIIDLSLVTPLRSQPERVQPESKPQPPPPLPPPVKNRSVKNESLSIPDSSHSDTTKNENSPASLPEQLPNTQISTERSQVSETSPQLSNSLASKDHQVGLKTNFQRNEDTAAIYSRYLTINYSLIRDKIYNNMFYPPAAQDEGWEGIVQLSFCIDHNGRVENIRVISSSGHSILDKSAIKAVEESKQFPPPPFKVEIRLPVVYRLDPQF